MKSKLTINHLILNYIIQIGLTELLGGGINPVPILTASDLCNHLINVEHNDFMIFFYIYKSQNWYENKLIDFSKIPQNLG